MNVLDALSACAGAAAVVPPLVYLLSISFLDNRPVPARAIVGSFAFAALGAYLLHHVPLSATGWGTYVFQYVAYSFDASVEGQTPGVLWTLVQAFVDVAAPEEAAKLLILVAFSRRYLKFNHPLEGVVLGAAVGLGFAAYENLLLVVHLPEEWSDDQLIRSILTVPMQGALGVIAGIYVARARFSGASGAGHGASYRWRSYVSAWLAVTGLHAVYDFPFLLVRNVVGWSTGQAHLLQAVGFVAGATVVLVGARLAYGAFQDQNEVAGRDHPRSILGYRGWRLNAVGGFASLLGALIALFEVQDMLRPQAFSFDPPVFVLLGAGLVVLATWLHRRAA